MRLLGSRWGSALVIGFKGTRWGVPTAFADLPRRQREAILQGWARSPHAKMRKASDASGALLRHPTQHARGSGRAFLESFWLKLNIE